MILVQLLKSATNGDYHTFSLRRPVIIKTKLVILDLFRSLFGWIWIGAAIASVYFLYGALANEAPVYYLLWSIGAGFIARNLAAAFKSSKEQLDYVDQLMERGYSHAEATSAWQIVINGGSNLLLNLQQADTIAKTDRSDDERNNSNAE